MSCFLFYFKPMGLYSGGLIHGLMFTLVTRVGLYSGGLILGWAHPWQFTVSYTILIEKEVTRIDKNGEEITKNISYILQFIDSARFMASSLSNLVNNLSK